MPVLMLADMKPAIGQELEPRTWSALPVGANFVGVSYTRSEGDIFFDKALPIENAEGEVESFGFRYIRALDLFGQSGRVGLVVPYAGGEWSGELEGEFAETDRSAFADPKFLIAVNILGAPAKRGAEFATFKPGTIVGVSLLVVAPLGQYDSNRLINLGSNRWTFRPQMGMQTNWRKWTAELTGSVWFFADNDDAFGGGTLEQDPLYALQGHLIYNFKPGLWFGLNAGFADGGATTINGKPGTEIDGNSRYGLSLGIPLGRRHGVKFAYSTGITTRIGSDFDNYTIAYQYMWGGGT